MAKPAITKRAVKAAALTYAELDTNFQNIVDSTISIAGDSGTTQSLDLNDTLTVAGGTGLTSVMTTDTVTLNLDNTAVTPAAYTNANITVDAQGRITAAANGSSGSGTVNSGTAGRLAYYASNGTSVSSTESIRIDTSYPNFIKLGTNLDLNGNEIISGAGNPKIGDDLFFTLTNTGPVGSGSLILRNTASYNTKITLSTSNIFLEGDVKFKDVSGTPANTATPTGYLQVTIGTTTRYIPYYT